MIAQIFFNLSRQKGFSIFVTFAGPDNQLGLKFIHDGLGQFGSFYFDLVTILKICRFVNRDRILPGKFAKIHEPPEACLMVGNDPINDMIATRAGLKPI
ncbi:MAG: hypothetical protein SRB2_00563 [Desulfobacteraceae bacterium Eth-SRB2]|nr:MAG: hypothetical protein SRB2_00563 [Desulfobacteraceae bacterium Eth-SRB2]